LQYNINRRYDLKNARWLSEDPIGFAGGDENLCRYVGNAPLVGSDPYGLVDWTRWPNWLRRDTTVESIEGMIRQERSPQRLRELQTAKKILSEQRRLAARGPGVRMPRGGRFAGCATPFNPLAIILETIDTWAGAQESGRTFWEQLDHDAEDSIWGWYTPHRRSPAFGEPQRFD
jgi:hypothetical protein